MILVSITRRPDLIGISRRLSHSTLRKSAFGLPSLARPISAPGLGKFAEIFPARQMIRRYI